jgi:hypothetical protein
LKIKSKTSAKRGGESNNTTGDEEDVFIHIVPTNTVHFSSTNISHFTHPEGKGKEKEKEKGKGKVEEEVEEEEE